MTRFRCLLNWHRWTTFGAPTFDEAVTRALDIYDSISPQPDRTHE